MMMVFKNIIIIFDDSGSMRAGIPSRLIRAKKATKQFIAGIPDNYNLGIYTLNKGYIFPLQTLNSKSMLTAQKYITNISATGSTPIAKSLTEMLQVMQKQKKAQAGYGSYTIVIATDGIADNATKMFNTVDKVIENNIMIHTIGIDIRNHGLRTVTKFTEASSTRELVNAMNKAIKSEISTNAKFVVQDF
jgi:Mg-chelatase subunit ChlD